MFATIKNYLTSKRASSHSAATPQTQAPQSSEKREPEQKKDLNKTQSLTHHELYKLIQGAHQPDLTDTDIAYPKPLQYIKAKNPREMIKGQAYVLSHIAMQSGLKEDEFIRYVITPVENFAAWVQLLPASESYHHTSIGGLFAHSLDVGLRALKVFENRNLYVEGSAVSREGNLPRFRLACFLGGLLHDIGKIFEDVTVVNREGEVWCSQIEPLYVWAMKSEHKEYKFIWRKGRYLESHELYTPYYIPKILSFEVLKYLSEGDPNVARILIGCLSSNTADVYGRMSQIISKADGSSTEYDTKHKHSKDASEYAYPIGLTFINCLRELSVNGGIKVNDKDSSVFITEHGAFILWTEKFFAQLDPLLKAAGFPAVEKRLELANLLVDSSVARVNEVEIPNQEDPEVYPLWKVGIKTQTVEGQEKRIDFFALRMNNPQRIFGDKVRYTDVLTLLDLTAEDMKKFGSLHTGDENKTANTPESPNEPKKQPESKEVSTSTQSSPQSPLAKEPPLPDEEDKDEILDDHIQKKNTVSSTQKNTQSIPEEDDGVLDDDFMPSLDDIETSRANDDYEIAPGVEIEDEEEESVKPQNKTPIQPIETPQRNFEEILPKESEFEPQPGMNEAEPNDVPNSENPSMTLKSSMKIHEVMEEVTYPVSLRITDSLFCSMSTVLRQNEVFTQSYLQVLFEVVLSQSANQVEVENIQDGQALPPVLKSKLEKIDLSDEAQAVGIYVLPKNSWIRDTEHTALSIGALATIMGGRTDTVARTLETLNQKGQIRLVKLKDSKFIDMSILNYRNLVSDALRKVSSGDQSAEGIVFGDMTKFIIHTLGVDFENARQTNSDTFSMSEPSLEALRKLIDLFNGQKSTQEAKPKSETVQNTKSIAEKAKQAEQRTLSITTSITTIDMVFESLRAQVLAQSGPWVGSLRQKDGLYMLSVDCLKLMADDFPEFSSSKLGNKILQNPGYLGFRIRGTQLTFDPTIEVREDIFED